MSDIPIKCKGDCTKKCADHGEMSTLVSQHETKINDIEGMSIEISNDINNLEGRVNLFIWIMGLVFMLLVSTAFYGVIQINKFRDVYMEDTITKMKAASDLERTVDRSATKISHLTAQMEDMRRDHTRTLQKVSESELTDKMEKVLEAYDKVIKEK